MLVGVDFEPGTQGGPFPHWLNKRANPLPRSCPGDGWKVFVPHSSASARIVKVALCILPDTVAAHVLEVCDLSIQPHRAGICRRCWPSGPLDPLTVTEFLQQIVNGLALGAIYALIALGYTMVYGVLRFINFAHSDLFMLGAYAGALIAPRLGTLLPLGGVANALVTLVLAMAICALLGVLIEILAYRPLRDRPRLVVLITAIGISMLIEQVAQNGRLGFGPEVRRFPALIPDVTWHLGGVTLGSTSVIVFGVTAVLLALLTWTVKCTRVGMAMRAVAFNEKAAALMGVNVNRIISFTFAVGSALAAAGGILFALNFGKIDPLMGVQPGLKAFVAAVLGGIGNLPGACLGGIVLGVVESVVGGNPRLTSYRDAVAFAVLILILLLKPEGLLGHRTKEKV